MKPNDTKRDLDRGDAFLPDPRHGAPARSRDTLAEMVGEGFVASATSAQDEFDEARNAPSAEEVGGPFIESTEDEELAYEADASNPEDAERAPFPSAVRSPKT